MRRSARYAAGEYPSIMSLVKVDLVLVDQTPDPTNTEAYSLTTVWKLTVMVDMSIICIKAPATSIP